MSSLIDAFTKFVLKVFWPWFLKHIWPLIVKHVIELFAKVLKRLSDRIMNAIQGSSDAKAASATQKAREAEQQANSSATQAERDKHEAVAKVWREVAEQFRVENESLKKQVAEALASQQAFAEREVNSMQPSLEGTDAESVVVIDGKRTILPMLPSPTTLP